MSDSTADPEPFRHITERVLERLGVSYAEATDMTTWVLPGEVEDARVLIADTIEATRDMMVIEFATRFGIDVEMPPRDL